jgi:hypothetical protein
MIYLFSRRGPPGEETEHKEKNPQGFKAPQYKGQYRGFGTAYLNLIVELFIEV